jgi:diadenosine tetraphosphate (Ap4A) HIT family hydrolase
VCAGVVGASGDLSGTGHRHILMPVSRDVRSSGETCLGCDVNALRIVPPGGTILGTDTWVADHCIPPLVLGYLILKPRRHVTAVADLDPAEAADFGVVAQRLMAAMREVLSPERIYLFAFGESQAHLHVHLMPRYPGMPPRGGALIERVFAHEWLVDEAAAAETARRIRESLGRVGRTG